MAIPNNIDTAFTNQLDFMVSGVCYPDVRKLYDAAIRKGYKIYVCNINRGYHSSDRVIVLPRWSFNVTSARCSEYWIYYLVHELCHMFSRLHDKKFMQAMLEFCPSHLQRYEIDYKPKAAKSMGLGLIDLL